MTANTSGAAAPVEGFGKVHASELRALVAQGLTLAERMVFVALKALLPPWGRLVSRAEVASAAGVHHRTARRALDHLEEVNLIRIDRGMGGAHASVNRIFLAAPAAGVVPASAGGAGAVDAGAGDAAEAVDVEPAPRDTEAEAARLVREFHAEIRGDAAHVPLQREMELARALFAAHGAATWALAQAACQALAARGLHAQAGTLLYLRPWLTRVGARW